MKDSDVQWIVRQLNGRPIVLVGLMGSGKTTVGRRLAAALKLPFWDADREIEAAAGMSISDIFALHGEDAFRDGERKVIARLMTNGCGVLATGGGAYMNDETRALINERAVCVWLKAEFTVLMERVRRNTNRPLLRNKDPEAVMRKLMNERYPVYAEADVTVQTSQASHDSAVRAVLNALKAYFSDKNHDAPDS
ncbi:MAG: shikimate kinase [Methylobacteriaceae bacterium]|nr:shikimate kinase [Methylobacteriaceae bacterium]